MLSHRLAFLVSCAALTCAACASGNATNVTATRLEVPDASTGAARGDLRVAPLDLLEIKVFGVADLNGSYQVDPEGKIKIPLIGIVDAKGYTVFELAKILETKLGQTYLQDPQVSIRVAESLGQQLTVEGAVAKPGMYPMHGALTLLQALAVSGGPTQVADSQHVLIFRTIEGKRSGAVFDITKIRHGKAEDPIVYGNDVIVVAGSGLKSGYDEFIKSVPLLGLFYATGIL